MKLITVILVAALAAPSQAQVAVTDPALTTVAQAHLALDKLHQQFIQLQMVQDAIVIKNNFLAAKEYYDTIYAHSQHRGGLMGYYKDYFSQEFQNMAADEWRRINTEASTVDGPTAVSSILSAANDAISKQTGAVINGAASKVANGMAQADLDTQAVGAGGINSFNTHVVLYGQKQRQIAANDQMIKTYEQRADARKVVVADLIRRGMSDMINDSEAESIQMHTAAMQLLTLDDIRQLLNFNAEMLNTQAKENLTGIAASLKRASDLNAFGAKAGALSSLPKPQASDLNRALLANPEGQ